MREFETGVTVSHFYVYDFYRICCGEFADNLFGVSSKVTNKIS